MEFRIPYYVSNGGDGSASLQLTESLDAAKVADEDQTEGWGESSAGEIVCRIEQGSLLYRIYDDGWKWVKAVEA